MRVAAAFGAVVVLAVAGPASAEMEYNMTVDATLKMDGAKWGVSVSKQRDVLQITQMSMRKVEEVAQWRRVAEAFVEPLGCGIPEAHVVQPVKGIFAGEVTYMCPRGVDLRQAIFSQRKLLKNGFALTKPETAAPAAATE